MAATIANGCERLESIARDLLSQLEEGKTPRIRSTTVRRFLKWFGYTRRGSYLTEQIRQCLEKNQLQTVPDFEGAWIDGPLSFELDLKDVEGKASEPRRPDPTIRLDTIDAAHTAPAILPPEANVRMALSLMQMDGISHVIVSGGGRSPMGVVSWKSIVEFLAAPDTSLDSEIRNCLEATGIQMSRNAPLFEATAQVLREGYVLVKGEPGKVGGIVTTSDLAEKYEVLALPFLMIGEIEGYFRQRIHSRLSQSQIDDALSRADDQRDNQDNHGLTFADYITLVGSNDTWNLLGLVRVDRNVLNEHLEWLRIQRNDIMHFTIDELRPSDLAKLKRLVDYFRRRLK